MSRISLKRSLLIFFLLISVCTGPAVAADNASPDKSVQEDDYIAIVNGKIIPKEALDQKIDLIRNRYASMGRPLEGEQLATLRRNILENMIEKELLNQEALAKGIKADPAEVEVEIDKLKSKFVGQEDFEKKLKEMNFTEELLRQQIRENLSIRGLIDTQIADKIEVTDKKIKSFYESNREEFTIPEQVHARHILIKAAPDASDAEKTEAKKKIKEIQDKLGKGADFSKLAEDYSQGPSSKNGGDLGFFSRGQMVESFDAAAFALEPGQTSDIVETRFGYHLIKVEDRKPETRKSLEEVRDQIREELKREQVMQQIGPYVETLKQKYPVEKNLPASDKE